MGVSNFNKFNKYAQEFNVTGYQLIMGADKSGRNVKGMLIGGYTFDRLSLYGLDGDDQIIELMQNIACHGVAEAYKMHVEGRKSVARQKINEAHGRSHDERACHGLEQLMTYADSYENVQFKGRTLTDVFNQLLDRNMDMEVCKVSHWVETMKDFHGFNKAKKLVFEMLNNKTIRVIDEHVVCDKTFRIYIDKWTDENGKARVNEDLKTQAIEKFCNAIGV